MQTPEHRTTGWVLMAVCLPVSALNFAAGNDAIGVLLFLGAVWIVVVQFANRNQGHS